MPLLRDRGLTFSFRAGATDVYTNFETSTDCRNWRLMQEAIDYTVVAESTVGGRTTQTLRLIAEPEGGAACFRETFLAH